MLCQKSRSAVKEIDNSNELTFIRLRSLKHEILVAPGLPSQYFQLIGKNNGVPIDYANIESELLSSTPFQKKSVVDVEVALLVSSQAVTLLVT